MARCRLIRMLVFLLLLGFQLPGQARPNVTTPSSPGLQLLRSSENGVVLELSTPAYDLTTTTLPVGTFHRVAVPGYDLTLEAGQPEVPLKSILLGVPPDDQVEVRILQDDAVSLPGRFKLSPAPRPVPLVDDLQPGELAFEPEAAAYATAALYPSVPARIAGDAWLRDQRTVRVELYPFQYNPAQGTLLWHRRLRVEVRFTGPEGNMGKREKGKKGVGEEGGKGRREKGRKGRGEEGGKGKREKGRKGVGEEGHNESQQRSAVNSPFEGVLRRALINYDTARAWRGRPLQHAVRSTYYALRNMQYPRYKITVDQDGLYRLSYEDLRAAGMDVDNVDPRTFLLTSQGQDVAIYVAGEDDGRFDPGDTITFYGQKFRGAVLAERYADEMAHWLTLCQGCELAGMLEKYTDENVYWLVAGGGPGPRMATVDGTPTDTAPVPASYRTTVHAEESRAWFTHHFTSEDTWFWERIQPGPVDASRTYRATLTALATGSLTATVRASVVSRSSNAGHHTQFYLNGGSEPLDDALWDGKSRYDFEAEVDQSELREGVNQLDFAVLYNGAFEDMYFDWFEIEYARQFQAEGDQLLFLGEESRTRQYEIEGFTDADVRVFDVSNPLAPQRVLNPRIVAANNDHTIDYQYRFEARLRPSETPAAGTETRPGRAPELGTGLLRSTADRYRVVFEVTSGATTQYLAVGATAVQSARRVSRYVPPDFSSIAGADYVFITHQNFFTATQTLADYRATQGLSTMVVDVADLYNEFNYGIFHPIAIRNFLAYALATWEVRPTYVLLMGDGHWNLKGYSGYDAPRIYMPPNLAFVDPWQGEVDSANLLAAVVGDDILPDLAIGRMPVNGVEELNAAISKIVAFEGAEPREWQQRTLFVADNVPDPAGDFVSLADDIIANHLPAGVEADRIYLNDYCGPPTSPPTPCSEVNAAIVDALNGTGAALVNYIGHASVQRWADEQVFVNSDISSLANGNRLPVVLSMTCLDGYYYYPGRPSLAEELVRAEGRGAVSTFSPTGLGVATGHHVMQRRFYDVVFQEGVRELGPATLAAKLALYATGGNYDLIHTFTIFGDPALRLPFPPAAGVYLPLIVR